MSVYENIPNNVAEQMLEARDRLQSVLNREHRKREELIDTPTQDKPRPTYKRQSPRQILAPIPWRGSEPPFRLARNRGFFGMDELHPTQLVHAMALGGTGVGKTTSLIAPLLRAMLRYKCPSSTGEKYAGVLVIDPKCELQAIVETTLGSACSDRLLHLGSGSDLPPVAFFEAGDGLTPRDKLARINVVLGTEQLDSGSHSYWHTAALEIILQFLELERAYREKTDKSLVQRLCISLEQISGFWHGLDVLFSFSRRARKFLKTLELDLKDVLAEVGLSRHRNANVVAQFTDDVDNNMQWHYRLQCAEPLVSLLADEAIGGVIDFEPFPDQNRKQLHVRDCLDHGGVLLFQPEATPVSEVAARALKVKVYEAVKTRSDLERPIGVVIDEFQKFITNDSESGDSNFLDTARAYRTNCVLATQSVAALHLRLGDTAGARAAVDAILANTPSKWIFALKDTATVASVKSLIPESPRGMHILDRRPLAQLRPGHAYWSLSNGDWGRGSAVREDLL